MAILLTIPPDCIIGIAPTRDRITADADSVVNGSYVDGWTFGKRS